MPGTVSHISSRTVQVIIGVDTHRDQHVAVAIDGRGVRLDEKHVPVAVCGYEELERWSSSLGEISVFGIEGTGSYGAGVARFMAGRGHTVIEVNRPDRSVRYRKGKSDPTNAEMAARSVLAGVADATPKSGEGEVEMIRMLKSARDSAVKARTQAANQMKALVVTAPTELREHSTVSPPSHSPSGAGTSDPLVWTIQRQRPSTPFGHLPDATANSVMRCGTWSRRSADSRGQSPRR